MCDKKKDSGLDGREIPLAIMLVGGGLWYKYGYAVQVWFHENMVQVVLGGVAVLILSGYILVRRFNKKNEEELERMRRLHQAKAPSRTSTSYYQRKRDWDRE